MEAAKHAIEPEFLSHALSQGTRLRIGQMNKSEQVGIIREIGRYEINIEENGTLVTVLKKDISYFSAPTPLIAPLAVLPEIGGRLQMALDKTNGYHFVYYNRVIKPALVGLAGPWISGGIEFNWPQHHRPSTFDPLDWLIEEHPDGSKTIWCAEIELMFHTKGMHGFTL